MDKYFIKKLQEELMSDEKLTVCWDKDEVCS